MNKVRYHDMLKDEIHELVSISGCNSLDNMIARAREGETYLELVSKRKIVQAQTCEG